ncbi:MAG TPA: urease accessory protein UreD [Pyrinomonadaceae bacterium]|nr:urease accessory protein UreD [Pyrinomonadaceae bacterium]
MAIQLGTAIATHQTSTSKRGESTHHVHGRLRLRFATRRDRKETIVAECEQQLPLRIVRGFQADDGGSLVHLHNLSGGVLGGDRLDLSVEVGPRAVAQLTSTGAARIYRSRKNAEPALQKLQLRVEDDGFIEYLPDQLIPFTGSRYRQETRIELGANAGVFWWETVAPGRAARNEMFAYDLLQLKAWISALGRPIAIENIRIEPAKLSMFSLARLGGYKYFSTFYICRVGVESSRWLDLERLLGELAEHLSRPSGTVWGVSALRAHGVVVRALSVSGREITESLPDFWRAAKLFLYDREAALPRKVY